VVLLEKFKRIFVEKLFLKSFYYYYK